MSHRKEKYQLIDSSAIRIELEKMVGGPGFEPGASRSRTVKPATPAGPAGPLLVLTELVGGVAASLAAPREHLASLRIRSQFVLSD